MNDELDLAPAMLLQRVSEVTDRLFPPLTTRLLYRWRASSPEPDAIENSSGWLRLYSRLLRSEGDEEFRAWLYSKATPRMADRLWRGLTLLYDSLVKLGVNHRTYQKLRRQMGRSPTALSVCRTAVVGVLSGDVRFYKRTGAKRPPDH